MNSVSFGNGGFLVKLRAADALTHWHSAELSLVHALPMCSNIDVTSTDARSILEYWTPPTGAPFWVRQEGSNLLVKFLKHKIAKLETLNFETLKLTLF